MCDECAFGGTRPATVPALWSESQIISDTKVAFALIDSDILLLHEIIGNRSILIQKLKIQGLSEGLGFCFLFVYHPICD